MEILFRLFMYFFPFAVSLSLYIWMYRKAVRVPHKTLKIVSVAIIVAGFAYTIYELATTLSKALSDDRFHFAILIVTVFVLFFASITMAFGEPEK